MTASMVTVALLQAIYATNQLRGHMGRALDEFGVTQEEIGEVILHLAFYAGWPAAVNAGGLAAELFEGARSATRRGGSKSWPTKGGEGECMGSASGFRAGGLVALVSLALGTPGIRANGAPGVGDDHIGAAPAS